MGAQTMTSDGRRVTLRQLLVWLGLAVALDVRFVSPPPIPTVAGQGLTTPRAGEGLTKRTSSYPGNSDCTSDEESNLSAVYRFRHVLGHGAIERCGSESL